MKNRTNNNQTKILTAIKKMETSLRSEIRRGDGSLRAELKRGDKLLRQEILKVEERVEDLEGGQKRIEDRLGGLESGQNNIISQMRQQHDEVMTTVSNFAGRVQSLEEENTMGTEQYRDHEKRIAKLEFTAQPA